MIELQTFVSETLIAVIKAVQQAQEATRDTGAIVNPPNVRVEGRAQTEDHRGVEDVHFDVAVTAADKGGKGGGVKIAFLSLSAEKNRSNSNASRVSFSVPVCWPVGNQGGHPTARGPGHM